MTPAQAELQELFLASQNLPNAYCDLGRIELGLRDIRKIAQSRCSPKQADAKAHYLLAGSGFNAEQIVAEISSLQFEQQSYLPATGVERYLTGKKQDSVYQSITKLVQAATGEFDAQLSSKISVDWTPARKRQIYELNGSEKPPKASRPSRVGKVLLGELPSISTKLSTLHRIRDYANAWFAKQGKNRLEALYDVSQRWESTSSPQLPDTWKALQVFSSSEKTSELAKTREFLELQYQQYVDEEINLRRKDAHLGGVPTPFNKIRVFVDLKYNSNPQVEHINKTPIWAQIYFLVRCGYIKEAEKLIKERKDIFDFIETSFANYFSAWASGTPLTPAYQQLIASDYAVYFRPNTSFDPFKQALYKIIGRCDLSHKSIAAAATTEDWLWLQTYLVRETTDYAPGDLKSFISKSSPMNFDPQGTNPSKYFNLLMLVGLYEQALDFLYETDEVSTVHFAMALGSSKMLALAEDLTKDAKMLVVNNAHTLFNLALCLARYTRLFRQQEPKTAADYLCFIAANDGRVYFEWSVQALQELVIESGLFVELLGDPLTMQVGYINVPGIESPQQYQRDLVLPAAEKVYEDGRITEAIVLYYIGEDYDKVISMTSSLVSQTLANTPLGQQVDQGEQIEGSLYDVGSPIELARRLEKIQSKHPLIVHDISATDSQTIQVLLKVADAMNALARKEYQQCFSLVDSIGLVPTDSEPNFARTRELANQFSQYSPSIAQIFPHLVEMVLVSCIHLAKSLKDSPLLVEQYRLRAGNCIAFVGLIQYYMPSQVYSRLAALESELSSL